MTTLPPAIRFLGAPLVSLLLVTGCQTVNGTNGGSTPSAAARAYGSFYDQGDHLGELVDKGDYEAAGRLITEQSSYFQKNADKFASKTATVARELNSRMVPRLKAAKAGIDGSSWPARASAWESLRRATDEGRTALDAYEAYTVLRRPEFRDPAADALKSAYGALSGRLSADAPGLFLDFDHGAGDFFAAYPLGLDRAAFLESSFPALTGKLSAAPSTAILNMLKKFSGPGGLSQARTQDLAAAYMAAARREGGGSGLKAMLAALTAAKAAGLKPETLGGGLKLGFVQATSQTLLREGQIDFPVDVDIDLPVDTDKLSLSEALSRPAGETGDFLVVIDVALAKASRRVRNMEPNRSRVIVGVERLPNPEWDLRQMEVSQAQNGLTMTQMPAYGVAALGNAFASIAATARLEGAKDKFLATPRYIEKPMEQDYDWQKAKIQAAKMLTVNYYVIDRAKGRYLKSVFDVTEREDFAVAYQVADRDTNKDEILKTHNTEKDVADWEAKPVSVRLSDIASHYASQPEGRMLPIAGLADDLLKDRAATLARVKAETFDDRPLNDPRFDSVVAVFRGTGSMGSGFFVRPDIVLTNWHVVETSSIVEMKTYDKQETFGKIVARDVRLDLALVKVQTRGKPVEFYDRQNVDLGTTIDVIGHPNRHLFSITRGIASAIRKRPSIVLHATESTTPTGRRVGGDDVLYIQTDAAVNHGNSGGPAFIGNKVVGVSDWGDTRNDGQGLNFLIHFSEVQKFLRENIGGF